MGEGVPATTMAADPVEVVGDAGRPSWPGVTQ